MKYDSFRILKCLLSTCFLDLGGLVPLSPVDDDRHMYDDDDDHIIVICMMIDPPPLEPFHVKSKSRRRNYHSGQCGR